MLTVLDSWADCSSVRAPTSTFATRRISFLCSYLLLPCSADRSHSHRAATTGALPFVNLILASTSPTKPSAPRLNMQDRAGNTPLHLAIESGFAEVAVALIEAGADRDRTDLEQKRPEEIDGVLGQEAKKVRDYSTSSLSAVRS